MKRATKVRAANRDARKYTQGLTRAEWRALSTRANKKLYAV